MCAPTPATGDLRSLAFEHGAAASAVVRLDGGRARIELANAHFAALAGDGCEGAWLDEVFAGDAPLSSAGLRNAAATGDALAAAARSNPPSANSSQPDSIGALSASLLRYRSVNAGRKGLRPGGGAMKRYIVGLVAVLAAIGTTVFSVSASAAPKATPILVGISAAKTGILGPYDLQAGQLFQLRIDQINKAGGVLGKQIKVKWIDTKSDKPTAATNASELVGEGAVAVLTTCDFDFSFPATQAAGAKKVLALSLCASSPKAATPAIVGQYGGSMGLGSDTEGVAMAEWFRAHKPSLKRVWITKDLSLEYSKATADYFKARWKQLGGTVCGEDTFTAGDNLDLSSNVTRLRGAVSKCDVIYDGSWNPFGAQYVRAVRDAGIKTTIITNASVNGLPVVQNNPGLSNFYALGFACLNTYCKGSKNPAVAKVNAQFKAKYGQPIGNHYALPGYELADALVAAIKKAGSTDGTKLASALYDSGLKVKTFAGNMAFTKKCHRPQSAVFTVEQYTGGKDKQIDSVKVKKVPSIGDGSPCSGVQPAK